MGCLSVFSRVTSILCFTWLLVSLFIDHYRNTGSNRALRVVPELLTGSLIYKLSLAHLGQILVLNGGVDRIDPCPRVMAPLAALLGDVLGKGGL